MTLLRRAWWNAIALLTLAATSARAEPAAALDQFDEAQYLANYPDLQGAFGTDTGRAVEHFVRYGLFEGRTDDPLPTATDDASSMCSTTMVTRSMPAAV